MSKELAVKLLTGLIAKLVRYGLVAAGGSAAVESVNASGTDVTQMAAGVSGVIVALVWSIWEDRQKKKAAE